ncbi:MAG: c-type cytochrome [Gammaproteobacteria bacterium]|nr:c-type cytochrome [Gammaproteobacteria bacterium]MCB1924625.1 c-type cytochrome [Gammaproteobacteria bacterium]
MSCRNIYLFALGGLLAAGAVIADPSDRLIRKASRYFAPLPATMPGGENDTAERVALGKQLYFDKRLSRNDAQACVSCHRIENGAAGVDNLPTSPGAEGQTGTRNSPTVINAGWQKTQFWDGRASDLADQAGQPILNPIEMGMPDEQTVVDKLAAIPEYQDAFTKAFPDAQPALSYANLREAIAAFERTLRSESRFDDFLRGDGNALSAQEQRGLAAFMKVNCVRCHDGPLIGGTLHEKLGVEAPFHNTADQGRYEVTKNEEDRMVFKVSQLRNVALTGPWFHDGSGTDLGEVVRIMARIQLATALKDDEVDDIVAFLHALNGKELAGSP